MLISNDNIYTVHTVSLLAMTSLTLSLAPPALVQLHEALTCLSRFNDMVTLEAEHSLASSYP